MPIKSKDLIDAAKKRNADALAKAFKSGDEAQMSAAMANFCTDVHDAVLAQAAETLAMQNQDAAVMASRGLHVLTSEETSYYNKLAECFKASDPKMALENFEVGMPNTVIDGVIGNIRRNHPLLDRVNFRNTAYLTRFILNASPADMAQWGKITDAVTKELSGKLGEINLTMCKLTAFMCISMDLIELGPQWMDQFVQETLAEAIATALELAVVDGTGKNQPIGMTRDISETASVVDGVYPRKTAVVLSELSPEAMGPIVASIARDPQNPTKARPIGANDLIFLCNPFDYWNKIMAATSFQKNDGTWARGIMPIPADLLQTAALEQGLAVLGIAKKYFLGLGPTGKKGFITKDDSVRFFEDERASKAKLQGNGRPEDEYAFVLLDISAMLSSLPVKVKVVEDAVAAAVSEDDSES